MSKERGVAKSVVLAGGLALAWRRLAKAMKERDEARKKLVKAMKERDRLRSELQIYREMGDLLEYLRPWPDHQCVEALARIEALNSRISSFQKSRGASPQCDRLRSELQIYREMADLLEYLYSWPESHLRVDALEMVETLIRQTLSFLGSQE